MLNPNKNLTYIILDIPLSKPISRMIYPYIKNDIGRYHLRYRLLGENSFYNITRQYNKKKNSSALKGVGISFFFQMDNTINLGGITYIILDIGIDQNKRVGITSKKFSSLVISSLPALP